MKVAIVCGSPSSEFLAPFDDEAWEIWVLGNRINRFSDKRVTRIFEIHDDLSEHGDIDEYCRIVTQRNTKVVVGKNSPISGDNVTLFPFGEAEALFGSTYLTSSTAYMMAMAILEGAAEIGVYGVDMAVDDYEYFWQRPCLEAWIGFAKGRGIKVTLPDVSPVLRCDYVEGEGKGGKVDLGQKPFVRSEFNAVASMHAESMAQIDDKIMKLQISRAAHDGARQAYERLAKIARAVEAGQDIKTLTHSFVTK